MGLYLQNFTRELPRNSTQFLENSEPHLTTDVCQGARYLRQGDFTRQETPKRKHFTDRYYCLWTDSRTNWDLKANLLTSV